MILLPIGHAEHGTKRLPWVTFTLMGICVLAFFISGQAQLISDDDINLSNEVMEAVDYYVDHPYLELDQEFRELAFDGVDEQELMSLLAVSELAKPPSSGATLAEEQAQLDFLTKRSMKSFRAHPFNRWGLVPSQITLITLITHMFMHAGWLHLLGNLLILYLAGPFIEDVWGRPLYLAFYLFGGLIAAAAFSASAPGSLTPMIGASGAIAAVMGAFLIRYWTTRIRFFYLVGLFWRGTFDAPAWLMLPLWFAMQLFHANLNSGSEGGGVAYWAHIGGFVAGTGIALAFAGFKLEERYLQPAIEQKIETTLVENKILEEALAARAAGDNVAAFEALAGLVERESGNHDDSAALWMVAVELGRTREIAPQMLLAIRHKLQAQETRLAVDQWLDLLRELPSIEAEPALLVRLARALKNEGRSTEARMTLRMSLLAAGSSIKPGLAIKIARTGQDLDSDLMRGAARLALAHQELEPGLRGEAEALLIDNRASEIGSIEVN